MIHFGLARKDESLEEKELWSPKLFLLLEENQKLVAPGAMRGPRFRIKAMLRIRLNGEIKKKNLSESLMTPLNWEISGCSTFTITGLLVPKANKFSYYLIYFRFVHLKREIVSILNEI